MARGKQMGRLWLPGLTALNVSGTQPNFLGEPIPVRVVRR